MTIRKPTYAANGATSDAGRGETQRVSNQGTTKKWLDTAKEDSEKLADASVELMKLSHRTFMGNGNEIPKIDMATLEAAMEIVRRQNEVFEGVRGLFKGGMSAQGMGARMAAENEFALKAIEENTEEAIKQAAIDARNRRAEHAAMEMAKGTFTQPVSER